jgi:hypothetical protein
LDGETAQWLGKIGDKIHAKLAAVGLVSRRQTQDRADVPTVGEFIDAFLASRDDLKPNTRVTFIQTRKVIKTPIGVALSPSHVMAVCGHLQRRSGLSGLT